MDTKRLYVDFHVLQTVPPSCVNRDDTGSPKTAVYGGATRARVSSQAWKHAIREMFKDEYMLKISAAEPKRLQMWWKSRSNCLHRMRTQLNWQRK